MVGHDQWNPAKVVLAAAHTTDRVVRTEQILRSYFSYRQDNLRLDQFDLAFQVVATGSRFARLRVAVIRRPAFQNVGDEHFFAALPNGEQHLVEQFPGPANEWLASTILFGSRRFANDQPVRIWTTDSEYCVSATCRELTTCAIGDAVTQFRPAQALGGQLNRFFGRLPGSVLRVARQPDINTHCLQVGTSLMFWVDHVLDREFSLRR